MTFLTTTFFLCLVSESFFCFSSASLLAVVCLLDLLWLSSSFECLSFLDKEEDLDLPRGSSGKSDPSNLTECFFFFPSSLSDAEVLDLSDKGFLSIEDPVRLCKGEEECFEDVDIARCRDLGISISVSSDGGGGTVVGGAGVVEGGSGLVSGG